MVIDSLQRHFKSDRSVIVLFGYFNYNYSETYRTLEVMQDLLQQLLRRDLHTDRCSGVLKEVKELGGSLTLSQVSEAFEAEIRAYSRVFIVLDGLDEALEDDRTEVVGSLLPLSKSAPLKILVTSRDHWAIKEQFQSYPRLEIVAQKEDMASHIGTFIAIRSRHLKRALKPEDIATVTEAIIQKSAGMYVLESSLQAKTDLAIGS